MKLVQFDKEKQYIKDFIKLTRKLYSKKNNMEDKKNIESFLLENHVLNKYFKLNKFLVYDNFDKVSGRFIITEYLDDKNICYIGFFECVNDRKISKFLFQKAYAFAKEKGYKKIVGPVDASFWNKYRLKINKFEKPYTGEPYNKDYYYKLFLDNNYKVIEHYVSNKFKRIDENYHNKKFTEHYKEFTKLGYKIVKPKIEEFDKCIDETYKMIMNLYSDFPIFKKLSKEDFKEIFNSYKSIINMNMVRMAYYKNEAVGFYISVPNYNNLVYHLNIFNILKILKLRRKPKEYVMLYMGVEKEHTGLGKALVSSIVDELKESNLLSIGALARDGKITQKYGSEVVESKYEYVLLERKVK